MEEKTEVDSFRFQYRICVELGVRAENAFNTGLEEEGIQAGKLAVVITLAFPRFTLNESRSCC